jgi:hypothetical protein
LRFIRSTLWAVRVCTNPVSRLLFFVGCLSLGPRENDLTNYWALGPFVRPFTSLVDPGDIYPPHPWFFRLVVVGGTQLRGSWYLSAIVRLQGFSSGSLAASPRRWSPKTVTSSSVVGRTESGCDLGSALSFKDLRHPGWGGSRAKPELYLLHESAGHLFFQLLVVETILQLCGGGVLQPCRGRRTVAAQLGCNIPSSVLAFAARTGVRACRCALEWPALAGAALVDRWTSPSVSTWWQLEKASPPSGPSTLPTDRPPALLALIACPRPSSGGMGEELVAAASAPRSSLLLFGHFGAGVDEPPGVLSPCRPSNVGGCSYLRGRNQSSICNGTLSAGVCSLWLSGPEHVCIFRREAVFFPHSEHWDSPVG